MAVGAGLGVFGFQGFHRGNGLFQFLRRRRPVHNTLKGQPHDRLDALRFLLQIRRQFAREAVHDLVMQQEKRLLYHGGIDARDTVGIHRRQIESLEQRHHVLAALADVHAAPPTAFARFTGHVTAFAHLHVIGFAAQLRIEPSGDGDQSVVQFLGIQPAHRHAGEKMIIRI